LGQIANGEGGYRTVRLHCLVRPRRGGGYIAECLELGMYYVEDCPGLAMKTLEDAIRAYEKAVLHFAERNEPIHPVRSAGYWWKRPIWSVLYFLARVQRTIVARRTIQAVSCDIRLPAWI